MSAADTIAELTGPGGLEPSVRERARAFEAWRDNRAPGDPIDDRLVLAYLLDRPEWSWATARSTVSSLTKHYRATIGREVRGPMVSAHLSRRRATHHQRLPLTEPLRVADAHRIADALEDLRHKPGPAQPAIDAMRAGLVVLRDFPDRSMTMRVAWQEVSRLRLQQTESGTHVCISGSSWSRDLAPDDAARWRTYLATLTKERTVLDRARRALTRVGLNLETPIGDLTVTHWRWLWHMLDAQMPRLVRDRAYLLVGLNHARRHADLRRLTRQDATATDTGFDISYLRTKNGEDQRRLISHVPSTEGGCMVVCAGCALADLLEWEALWQTDLSGPVFATVYGGTTRAMTRQNARYRIRALTALADGCPWGSTRSLRAGAATSAWEAGWTLEEIAHWLTGHRDINQAACYIRRLGGAGGTLQLDLDGPPPAPAGQQRG